MGELLDDLPEDKRTLVSVAISARSHRGPLPDPETLAAYKAIDSRLVDEVIQAASENRKHRYIMDRKLADTARYSLIFSAALVLAALIAAVILAIVGHPVVGGILGGGGLGAIVFTLIRGGGIWSGRGPQKELDRGTATRPTMPS